MRLTEKQKKFIDYYIETGNATEAAKRAEYSPKAAYAIGAENLKKPQIKSAIDSRLKEIESSRIADAKEVLQFLTASMRGEVKEEVVVVEGDGDGCSSARIITKQLSARDRLDAAKQLAKRFGLDSAAIDNVDEGPVILEGGDDIRD